MKKILLLTLLLISLTGCKDKTYNTFTTIEDLKNKSVGVVTGCFHGKFMEDSLDGNVTIKYVNSVPEGVLALKAGKIEAFVTDGPTALVTKNENPDLDFFEIEGTNIDSGLIFSEDKKQLLQEFNEFLKECNETGFFNELEAKWIKNPNCLNETIEVIDYIPTKGIINVITSSDSPPFAFISDGEMQGCNVEIVKKFAQSYGYELNFDISNFDGVLSGVTSGKYDIGIDEITITDERKRSLQFSDPIHASSVSVMYRINGSDSTHTIYTSPEELNGKKLGCMSGSLFDMTIKEQFPDSEVIYFNSRAELLMGLKQGKIEGYLADKPVATVFKHDNSDIDLIEGNIQSTSYGFCFSKENVELRNEFNDFLKEAKEDGFLKKMQDKWFAINGIEQVIEQVSLTGTKGLIKACTTQDGAPFAFYKDNKYQGYEVDLLLEFAKRNDYDLQIDGISFDAIISSVVSNKYDLAFNGITISKERAKSIDFSDPDYESCAVVVIRNNDSNKTNFFSNIKNKIYRTFIEEDRYKLIFDGILTTLFISFSSIVLGTIIGFVFFLVARKFNGLVKKTIDILAYIIAGLPVVVILMILFYIIFAKSSLSGSFISIIGFTLIVGLSVYGMLNTGVNAIDIGQFEAALALGYTERKALFKFILPQAFRIIMPSYRGEIISLIKSSSIVGYVTVQDLTRVSDIIRSRTYDAFFPLIVTAIIYFIIAWLLTKLADFLQKKYLSSEKSKDEILKNIGQK